MIRKIITAIILCFPLSAAAQEIKVEPGDYAIQDALIKARRLKRLKGVNAVLRLAAGTYRVNEPIIVRPEDNGAYIIGDSGAVISGGVRITGWKKQGDRFVADAPEFNGRQIECRQLWVNGVKAVRARDVSDFEDMSRILGVDKQRQTIFVPAEAVRQLSLDPRHHPEMVIHEMWCVSNLRIKDIAIMGDTAALTFCQPESRIHFMRPWPSPMVTGEGHNSAFFLTDDEGLLDKPGEWFFDREENKIIYIPRQGEDMLTADVEVSAAETLLKVEGTPDERVSGVTFRNITFAYAAWTRPGLMGHVPLQAGMFMIEAYRLEPKMERVDDHKLDNQGWVGRPSAAVLVNSADNVLFDSCRFIHNASTGIDFNEYVRGGGVRRSVISDCGGSGILAGSFDPEGYEAHKPYNPSDKSIICSDLVISDNKITDVANEDWGCLGIGAGNVYGIDIASNEISEVSYTGISVGWGWNRQPCAMGNNHIHGNKIRHYAKHMYDTAGIYTLGNQPGSVIEDNTISDIYHPSYAHDPEHWFYLYTDEGSSNITIRDNHIPSAKILKNANGPGNVWENNE